MDKMEIMDSAIKDTIAGKILADEAPLEDIQEDIISDNEVLSIAEVLDKMKEIVEKLNDLDNYKLAVSKKRAEIDGRDFDLMHELENVFIKMEEDPEFKLTAKGCRNFIEELMQIRAMRRALKVSDNSIYEFQSRSNKLNNEVNRQFLLAEVNKETKKLTRDYRHRVYSQEELNKIFDVKEKSEENGAGI